MGKMKIGIPRGLMYFEYGSLWIHFFKTLGLEVVISKSTGKNTIKQGTAVTVDDACIPVKLYHGHVLNLINQVDFLFIPRIIGVSKGDFICPKLCGLPEMVSHSIKNLPILIKPTIDFTKSKRHVNDTILEIGAYFTDDRKLILRAYREALKQYKDFKSIYKQGLIPNDYLKKPMIKLPDAPKIMVMGHPYVLYDAFLNMNILTKLQENGFLIQTPDMVSKEALLASNDYHGKIFWRFSRLLIGTSIYLTNNPVDGVIYLSSFGCGVDSILIETVERRIRKANIPFMTLILDEHTGEAGFNTRLEAYMDLLKWRLDDEGYIPTHGQHLCSDQNDARRTKY